MGRRELEERIEKRREDFVRNSLLSDEFIDFVQENLKPVNTMMAYYQCAIMEVETKFKVRWSMTATRLRVLRRV